MTRQAAADADGTARWVECGRAFAGAHRKAGHRVPRPPTEVAEEFRRKHPEASGDDAYNFARGYLASWREPER